MGQAAGTPTNTVVRIDLEEPVDDPVDRRTHPFQQRRIERVSHDHEAISVEQFDGSIDIYRFHQLEIRDSVLQIKALAERDNIRVVIAARPADNHRVTRDEVVVLRCRLQLVYLSCEPGRVVVGVGDR